MNMIQMKQPSLGKNENLIDWCLTTHRRATRVYEDYALPNIDFLNHFRYHHVLNHGRPRQTQPNGASLIDQVYNV